MAAIAQSEAFPLSGAAWSDSQWGQRCKDVRTSYNPAAPLNTKALTLKENDPRFLDFLYWVWANKILEHQVEQVGALSGTVPRTASSSIGLRDLVGKPIPSPPLSMRSITSPMNMGGAYQRLLAQHGVIPSMSRKGNCFDNTIVESFFSTLKNELGHDQSFHTREDAQAAVFEFIEAFYNRQRLHQTLGYVSPTQFETEHVP